MPRIQRLLMGLVLVISLNGCTKLCADNCQQSNQRCLALNTQLIHQLKAQEQNFNAWAQEIYHNRDYKERQASIVKGCDVLIPVCTDAMTKEGRELIALGFGGLDKWQVWVISVVKLTILVGLILLLLLFGINRIGKLMSDHQSEFNAIERKREELALVETEIEKQRQSVNQARTNLSLELVNTQTQIATNRQTLEQLHSRQQTVLDEIALTQVHHDELKTQVALMEAVARGLR